MSNAAPPGKTPPAPPREIQPIPGLLSFLVPGLGQIYQGRVSKGILFLLCIYGLFFYGLWLGSGTVRAGEPERTYSVSGSVYLPEAAPKNAPSRACRSWRTTCTTGRSTLASSASASWPGRPSFSE